MARTNSKDNDFIKLFAGNTSLLRIQSNIVEIEGTEEFNTHLEQHFQGKQRVGVMPFDDDQKTKFAVIRFGSKVPSTVANPLGQAEAVQRFLADWKGARVTSTKPSARTRQVSVSGISSYIFRGPFQGRESYEVVLFFAKKVDVLEIWSIIKALLIGLCLDDSAEIIPGPADNEAFVFQNNVFYSLPLFPGAPDTICRESCGGLDQHLTTYIKRSDTGLTLKMNNIDEKVVPIKDSKIDQLKIVLEEFMDEAYRMAKVEIDRVFAKGEKLRRYIGGDDSIVLGEVLRDEIQSSNADIQDSDVSDKKELVKVDYSAQIQSTIWQNEVRAWVSRWKEFPDDVVNREMDLWIETRVTHLPAEDALNCLHYFSEELRTNFNVLCSVVRSHLIRAETSLLFPYSFIPLCLALDVKKHQIGCFVARWFSTHEGEFSISETGECVLTYHGKMYLVANEQPFRTLVWEAIASYVSDLTLDDIWIGVECEANSIAGRTGERRFDRLMTREQHFKAAKQKFDGLTERASL